MHRYQNTEIYYNGLQEAQTLYRKMANDPRLTGNQQKRHRRVALIAKILEDHLAINDDGSASISLETILETARQEGISHGLSDYNLKKYIREIFGRSRYHYIIKINPENRQADIYPR